jgi:hypothetical protein
VKWLTNDELVDAGFYLMHRTDDPDAYEGGFTILVGLSDTQGNEVRGYDRECRWFGPIPDIGGD